MSMILGRIPSLAPAEPAIGRRWLRQLSYQLRLNARTVHIVSSPRAFSSISTRAKQQNAAAVDKAPFAITWLTQTPDDITPNDILRHLPSVPLSDETASVPVLLVTPAFAPWIDPTSPFLEECMSRLSKNSPGHQLRNPRYAIAAVVDKLPDSRDDGNSLGYEGLSLLLARVEDVSGKVATPSRLKSTDANEPAFIYSVQPLRSSAGSKAAVSAPYEVGLRLANTVFVNGKDRTIFGLRWDYDPTAAKFRLGQCCDLSNCTIASSAESVHSSLEIPLYPVSQRRKVISSMGNILRQVSKSVDGKSNEPMPASSELEKELPRYVAECDIAHQRVSVWALVERPDRSISTELLSPDHVASAICKGSALHRVVSGGGGWGKKQGLLSLDPETTFADSTPYGGLLAIDELLGSANSSSLSKKMQDFPVSFEKLAFGDDLSSLSQVAKQGEYIQFFVSVEPKYQQNSLPGRPEKSEGALSCRFGVISAAETPEVLPGQSSGHSKDVVILPNYFGALSEKAITYSQPVHGAVPLDESSESRTKLDVPGCRVELVTV